MNGRRPRVAFVVQRCGDDLAGGAERLCRDLARAMSPDWDCEILTTCARDTSTWRDAYPAGRTAIGGVPALRFPVDRERDPVAFDALSERVRRGASFADQQRWMRAQGPESSALLAYVTVTATTYDRFIFFSYLYATTFLALPLVADRATLVPLAHDEWMLALPLYNRLFAAAATVACVSPEERGLVVRRFPAADVCGALVAPGIEAPATDPARFRRERGIDVPFAVVVGRVDRAKGIDRLLEYFAAYKRIHPGPRALVLVGPIAMKLPSRGDVVALGLVDDAAKWDALAAADVAIVPSEFESLSLAMLEAWAVATPVIASGASAVLVGQCRRANGGLWYANEREFVELMSTDLLGCAATLGHSGKAYVARHYDLPLARAALREATGLP